MLPAVGKALGLGALTGLASLGVSKILGNGLYMEKGNTLFNIETDGKGLYLGPQPVDDFDQVGNGLHIYRDGEIMDGMGLVFGENSPFSKIPLIGPLIGALL